MIEPLFPLILFSVAMSHIDKDFQKLSTVLVRQLSTLSL